MNNKKQFVSILKYKIKNKIQKVFYVGESTVLEEPVTIYPQVKIRGNVAIGRFTYVNRGTTVFYGTSIGRFSQIGKNCEVGTVDHPIKWLSSHPFQYNLSGHFPNWKEYVEKFEQLQFEREEGAKIGSDVWIGSLSIIKSGITIGDGAIVGAGSVVTKDIPPFAIVGGVPARLIRYRFDEETTERLLAVKWWDRELKDLDGIDFSDIDKALKQLEL
jgi:acetyltransferase-like isoleucine patch superfamily enzyme